MTQVGNLLVSEYKLAVGQSLLETALVNDAFYPASTTFIDVQGRERIHVLIHMGTIAGGDTPTFTLMEADAADGTPQAISTTYLQHVASDTGDGRLVTMTLETAHLTDGFNWVTLQVTGIAGTSYANAYYFLQARCAPDKQDDALLPEANQYCLTG